MRANTGASPIGPFARTVVASVAEQIARIHPSVARSPRTRASYHRRAASSRPPAPRERIRPRLCEHLRAPRPSKDGRWREAKEDGVRPSRRWLTPALALVGLVALGFLLRPQAASSQLDLRAGARLRGVGEDARRVRARRLRGGLRAGGRGLRAGLAPDARGRGDLRPRRRGGLRLRGGRARADRRRSCSRAPSRATRSSSRIEGNARFARDRSRDRGGRAEIVFLLRLSPVFPFNLLNYALGPDADPLRRLPRRVSRHAAGDDALRVHRLARGRPRRGGGGAATTRGRRPATRAPRGRARR